MSRQCLKERDQAGLNITLDMVDSAIQFTCHRDGDRVACKYFSSLLIISSSLLVTSVPVRAGGGVSHLSLHRDPGLC